LTTCFDRIGHHQALKVMGEETAVFLRRCLVVDIRVWFPLCACVSVTSVILLLEFLFAKFFLYNFTCFLYLHSTLLCYVPRLVMFLVLF
jgi:hypothetical protein